jgi:hypothetical protein
VILLRRVSAALDVAVGEILLAEAQDSVERRLFRRFLERLPPHRLDDVHTQRRDRPVQSHPLMPEPNGKTL